MKKLFFLSTTILIFALCSCDKQTSENFVPLNEITCSRTITINTMTKAGDVSPIELTLTALYNVDNETVTSLDISSTDSDLDINWLKSEVAVKFEEMFGCTLEDYCISGMPMTKGTAADCFKNCNENFEKGKGRGWCKAECVIDKVVEVVCKVLETLADILD